MPHSQTKRTRFRLTLPGLTVEVSGQRAFVEEMYGQISTDLAPLFDAGAVALSRSDENKQGDERVDMRHLWVYVHGPYYNKVYVCDILTVERGLLGRFVDVDRVRRIHADSEQTARVVGLPDDENTLWAEFTEEGKEMLRRAIQD